MKLGNDEIPILDKGQQVSIATINQTTIDSITNATTIGDNETTILPRLRQQLHGRIPNGCQKRLTTKSRKQTRILRISLVITAMKKNIIGKNV